jgi:ATP-dependent DNA ligase
MARVDGHGIDAWRPQAFGPGNAKRILDALVEPLWAGYRVLAFTIAGGPARLVDPDGVDLAELYPSVASALAAASAADRLVLDGYLTDQATRSPIGVTGGEIPAPSAKELTAQFFLGGGAADVVAGRTKVDERTRRTVDPALAGAAGAVAFVAVDLLLVDDEVLLDIPLLERKRVLESVLAENELVRRTPFVREPLGSFLASWRAQGFGALAYKSANGRYTPGVQNPGWATAAIPRR